MPPQETDRAALAGEVVALLMLVTGTLRDHLDGETARLGLTPAAARALVGLDPRCPQPTRLLAERLHCDPSNVTGLVDRLVRAGLVRREADPRDRRIKAIVVTDAGRALRDQLRAAAVSAGTVLDPLDEAELRALHDLVMKLAIFEKPQAGEPS
jgi:DNA-binding MarR family transcriptional regulator